MELHTLIIDTLITCRGWNDIIQPQEIKTMLSNLKKKLSHS